MAVPMQKPEAPETPRTDEAPAPEPVEPRRGALRTLVTLGGIAYAGALALPGAGFVVPAGGEGQGSARWIRLGRLADLPEGEPRRFAVVGDERDGYTITREQQLGSVWVIRKGDKVRIMSAVCPHLGCSIDVAADKKAFSCPCHTSKFSLAGDAQAGPSPRAMDELTARIVDGYVEVDFKRFRMGIATREVIG